MLHRKTMRRPTAREWLYAALLAVILAGVLDVVLRAPPMLGAP